MDLFYEPESLGHEEQGITTIRVTGAYALILILRESRFTTSITGELKWHEK